MSQFEPVVPPVETSSLLQLATLEDFEIRHGTLAESEKPPVDALLKDASALIVAELVDLPEDWYTDTDFIPPLVLAVCVQVAYRGWRNPDGVASEMLGVSSTTYRGGDQPDALWLTENEKRMVRRAAGKTRVTSIPVETPYSGADAASLIGQNDLYPIRED